MTLLKEYVIIIMIFMTKNTLLKSTGIIGGATSISRVLGFVRDILIASKFGTGIFAQAFVVAFRLPNLLRDMVAEGATDAAIVPILTEYRHTRTHEEYWEAARIILNLMLSVLIVLSVIGVIFAPIFVRVIAPGFMEDPDKFAMTVLLTRMVFPYILLAGLVAYSKGVLNSLNYFTTPAIATVILNITIISSLLFLTPIIGIKGLIVGVILGGIFEVLIQVPQLRKRGFVFKKEFHFRHPLVNRIGKLLLPRAVGTAVYQMSVFIDTILASLSWVVGAGGVAALYFSTRLVQLPLAIFGISLATAALPKMTKEVAENDMVALKETVSFSLRTVFAVMVPATVGLMVLANPIVRILFQRGEFDSYSTAITVNALFFYSIGLFAYAGVKILVSTFYSMGDTRTPVRAAGISLGINVVLNLILMWPLKVGGLALATSIAAISNFSILYVLLNRRIGDIGTKEIVTSFIKIIFSGICMGFFAYFAGKDLIARTDLRAQSLFFRLGILVISSVMVYLTCAYFVKVEEISKLFYLIAKKFKKS